MNSTICWNNLPVPVCSCSNTVAAFSLMAQSLTSLSLLIQSSETTDRKTSTPSSLYLKIVYRIGEYNQHPHTYI